MFAITYALSVNLMIKETKTANYTEGAIDEPKSLQVKRASLTQPMGVWGLREKANVGS